MILNKTFPRKQMLNRGFINPSTSLMTSVKELDRAYHVMLRRTLIFSTLALICLFQVLPKKMQLNLNPAEPELVELIAEELPPPTQQFNKPPPPPRPAVPIPVDDDEIPEDLTIAETEIDFDEMAPPPPPPPSASDEEGYRFIAFDTPPELIGGLASLNRYLEYPPLAIKAGIESSVIVGVLLDEKGNTVKTTILKDSGSKLGFEEAAQEAVMKTKWIPARQRDKPTKVWVTLKVRFQLTDTKGRD